jgi:lysozyme
MTNAEIDALTASDTASTVVKLDTYLPWWRTLDPVRQRVLLNMCFQLGIGRPGKGTGLLGFGQFLNLVQARRYADAATDMLGTLWAKQTPNRAKRLSAMMRTGVSAYPTNIYGPAKTPAAPKPARSIGPVIAVGAGMGGATAAAAMHGNYYWPLVLGVGIAAALVAIVAEIIIHRSK